MSTALGQMLCRRREREPSRLENTPGTAKNARGGRLGARRLGAVKRTLTQRNGHDGSPGRSTGRHGRPRSGCARVDQANDRDKARQGNADAVGVDNHGRRVACGKGQPGEAGYECSRRGISGGDVKNPTNGRRSEFHGEASCGDDGRGPRRVTGIDEISGESGRWRTRLRVRVAVMSGIWE